MIRELSSRLNKKKDHQRTLQADIIRLLAIHTYIELACHFRSRSILNWHSMPTLLWLSLAIYTLLTERPKVVERSIQLLNVNFIYV